MTTARLTLRNAAVRAEADKLLAEKYWWSKTKVFVLVGLRFGLDRSTVHQIYHRKKPPYAD